jgi:hypothetical protein
VDVRISLLETEQTGDELRKLRKWLVGEDDLRGRVRVVERAPEPGMLGSWPEALNVALAPGGAVAVLVGAVIAWIRNSRGDLSLKLTRSDGTSAEVRAKRVRELAASEIPVYVEHLSRMLAPEPDRILDDDATGGDGSTP